MLEHPVEEVAHDGDPARNRLAMLRRRTDAMYVTTFYSFKGGVGRTMALVNVAVELAQRGRRVLAVDFDLEAPGLDTFNILRSRKRRPGIVDFVTEYLDTGRAPRGRTVHPRLETRCRERRPSMGDAVG